MPKRRRPGRNRLPVQNQYENEIMASNTLVTQEYLRRIFTYDQESGVLIRRTGCKGFAAGHRAGSIKGDGYVKIEIGEKRYRAHRLIWLYVHGEFPVPGLDHVDGDRSNNRLPNLRLANSFENGANRLLGANSTSGLKGVSWYRWTNKWVARIRFEGIDQHLGYFEHKDDAGRAYDAAAARLFGEFARTNESLGLIPTPDSARKAA